MCEMFENRCQPTANLRESHKVHPRIETLNGIEERAQQQKALVKEVHIVGNRAVQAVDMQAKTYVRNSQSSTLSATIQDTRLTLRSTRSKMGLRCKSM